MYYPLLFLDLGRDWHYKSFIFDQPDETSLLLITHSYCENSADLEDSTAILRILTSRALSFTLQLINLSDMHIQQEYYFVIYINHYHKETVASKDFKMVSNSRVSVLPQLQVSKACIWRCFICFPCSYVTRVHHIHWL